MNKITIILENKEYQIDVQKAKELGVIKEKDPRCKSWEFENPAKHYVFTIEYSGGRIIRNAATSLMWNRILVFPTAEMRDAFYENFKELIEKCKELL